MRLLTSGLIEGIGDATVREASAGGQPRRFEIWNSPAFRLVDIGAFLAVSIVVPTWLGSVIDGRLGTDPVLTLVGLTLGLAGGLYGAFRQLQDFLRLQSERRGK